MPYEKDLNSWNEFSKKLETVEPPYFREQEIWWIAFGTNIGVEIDGKHELFERPGIIFKKLNREYALVIPITRTENKIPKIHVPISCAGIKKGSVATISQIRSMSSKRLLRKAGVLPLNQFAKLLDKFMVMVSTADMQVTD
ncbi:type II toxin-antitoxin system PemK/MazF family toxin [Patescibacteria group bacterium]|nr:type II toxin-antitoxin system PemK/MazF family toxin [Patescibacteria group bacterium]MDE1946399.1 type II toxin-antitoxin system PemK/MazF family toxin [Patescibacteria group bacterium]MDE2011008.1 type II toxin-antitoxin system PemK/MazF family toxin [Patescibacteria group bacterium]MDE2233031.1 type II toxin-antitoxin system PemK/MazF family toxin [Patescibacteria group bacterium]